MERVVVWKHNLESVAETVERAYLICSTCGEQTSKSAFDLDSSTAEEGCNSGLSELIKDTVGPLYHSGHVLDLLADNLESTVRQVEDMARGSVAWEPAVAVAPKTTIPTNIDLSHFDDISDEDLLQELRRQKDIIASAQLDSAIIVELLTRRVAA